MDPAFYDEDYFLRGKETGKSLYTDYRWLPDLTVPMAKAMALHLGMERGATVLDFGCARGYLVKALNMIGYRASGYDPSQWVIDHCDPEVAGMVTSSFPAGRYDWVVAKDVLEHVEMPKLAGTIRQLAAACTKGLFFVVPLSPKYGDRYVVPEYDMDVTHQIRMSLTDWFTLIRHVLGDAWYINTQFRVEGIKDNYYADYPKGNGFITAKRT